MIPDGIERDGRTWRVGLESDVEYILVLAVWQTWQATGDDRWMAAVLPALERALAYVRSDPNHWDAAHALVRRQHSCDTWDFDIPGASERGEGRHVIAACDQSEYVLAYRDMGALREALGDAAGALRWRREAEAYRGRANALLWDGTKYLHHVHLDPIEHGDFDETQQLAMGNTWAMTRGLATPEQARRILDEYRRRHVETGDAHPWWSLPPGYPDHLGYFPGRPHLQQGGYANGGLMPWVGGELCRAAFRFGRESYGVALLRDYLEHLRKTGGAQVWYWPDGTLGFRTVNEVPYAGWGMAEWVHAAVEGLAGVPDDAGQFRAVTLSPRWAAAGVGEAQVCVRYSASKAYVAYRLRIEAVEKTLTLDCTGSGGPFRIRVLLPAGWTPEAVRTGDGRALEFTVEQEDASRYACFVPGGGVLQAATVRCVGA